MAKSIFMRLNFTYHSNTSFLTLLLLATMIHGASASPRNTDRPFKFGPASGANITWTACSTGTLLNESNTGSASYTFTSASCDGNGFTAITDGTGEGGTVNLRILIGSEAGDHVLRFDRSAAAATFTAAHFKSTAGDLFQLTNIEIFPLSPAAEVLTITGYRAGVAIAGSTHSINVTAITGTTLTSTDLGTDYGNIDEIRLTSSLGLGVGIANIVTASAPLPLTLIDFSALKQGNTVQLNWTTAQEENTNYFEVQRSSNGTDFGNVGKVDAAGNSTSVRQYSYEDIPPAGSTSLFYRLQMTDLDGLSTYSPVVHISPTASTLNFSATPNPFQQQVTVSINASGPDNATITLTDMSGRSLMTQTTPIQKGTNVITLRSLSQLDKGIYLLHISTATSGKQTIELLKNQ